MVRVSTIPAGVPFVDALARGLLAEAGGDPLVLADMLVLLPNRRACRSLRDAFWRARESRALALPNIQPIGDLDPDDLLLDTESELDLPPAISGLRRRLLLTRMLLQAKSLDLTIDQASRLAEDLAALLDELQTERVPFEQLDDLVPDMFAKHWRQSAELLRIIGLYWPAVLADEQAIDPAERRHRILTAIAQRWEAARPEKRIVAAGSTGSIPATRELLRVIASLPNGEVVLPGLEIELDGESWKAIDPQHPQYGLSQALNAFGLHRREVQLWSGVDEIGIRLDPRQAGRRALLREVMRPCGLEGGWQGTGPIGPSEIEGLSLAEHSDPAVEALAITLRLRAALLVEGRSAALITPDRTLARRVVVELKRFGIHIDDSAGVPLDQTAPGGFLLLAAQLIADEVRPVALLSVLKHPLMRAGLEADVVRQRARALDRLCLRGPAIMGGFSRIIGELNGLRQATADDQPDEQAQWLELRDWLDSLSRAAQPFSELFRQGDVPLGTLVVAHLRFVEALAMVDGSAEALWAKEAGEAASALFRELLETVEPDDRISPEAYPALLAQIMTARPVRPRRPGHPRLFIWGQLEARLQQTDLTILAGLNEGVWPRTEEPGPWLNPAMRDGLGLPPLERRVGQAAHDFVQAAAGGEVVLSRAEKDMDGSPTVPSRWVIRLKAYLAASGIDGACIAEDRSWQDWALSLDQPSGVASPAPQPKPRPPVADRPRKLPVSDIERWMKNPYGLYAKRILGLKPLDPLEADPGAADRGMIIHKVLERFVKTYPRELPADALERLRDFGVQAFVRYNQRPQVRAIWWPRFLRVAEWVVVREAEVRCGLSEILAEVKGELVIEAPLGPFRLTARADRLERQTDGGITVVDYKTGRPPSKTEMKSGLSPQLPLEGMMLKEGGFADLRSLELQGLQFWQLSGGEGGGKLEPRPLELVEGVLENLSALIRHYDQAATTYPASYRPPTARRDDYDHLARLGEWPN